MKTLSLTDEARSLLLTLLQANLDTVEQAIQRRFGPEVTRWRGAVPTRADVMLACELELTKALIKELRDGPHQTEG